LRTTPRFDCPAADHPDVSCRNDVYGGDVLQRFGLAARSWSLEAARLITQAAEQAGSRLGGGIIYTGLALATMLAGISAFSSQLKNALNAMWNVPSARDQTWASALGAGRNRFSCALWLGLAIRKEHASSGCGGSRRGLCPPVHARMEGRREEVSNRGCQRRSDDHHESRPELDRIYDAPHSRLPQEAVHA
jgi:hypothetical protein